MTTEATPGTSLAGTLSIQFQFCSSAFHANVKDITHEESLQRPGNVGSSMNWIVGHIVSARSSALSLLGLPPIHTKEEMTRYQRGAAPLTEADDAIDFGELLSDFDKAQDKIVDALARTTPEHLAAPLPKDANPFQLDNVGEMLAALTFHEAYHVGQLGVARRRLGKEPGIR